MADSSVAVLDSAGVARNIDAQTLSNGDFQQTVNIGDGVNSGRTMSVEADGSARVGTNVSTVATKSSVTAVATDVLILAANVNRRGFMIFNEGGAAVLNLSFGTTAASATSYSVRVAANAVYVGDVPLFTGQIRGIWTGTLTSSVARITEFTA